MRRVLSGGIYSEGAASQPENRSEVNKRKIVGPVKERAPVIPMPIRYFLSFISL